MWLSNDYLCVLKKEFFSHTKEQRDITRKLFKCKNVSKLNVYVMHTMGVIFWFDSSLTVQGEYLVPAAWPTLHLLVLLHFFLAKF